MKITDLKCAVIGRNPVVRIVTDEGVSGYGEVEHFKPYIKPYVLRSAKRWSARIRPTSSACMLKIRQRGAFKPWGAAVSAIENALWDIAGKAAGLAGLQAAGRQGPRPGARLQRRRPRSADGPRPEDYARTWRR